MRRSGRWLVSPGRVVMAAGSGCGSGAVARPRRHCRSSAPTAMKAESAGRLRGALPKNAILAVGTGCSSQVVARPRRHRDGNGMRRPGLGVVSPGSVVMAAGTGCGGGAVARLCCRRDGNGMRRPGRGVVLPGSVVMAAGTGCGSRVHRWLKTSPSRRQGDAIGSVGRQRGSHWHMRRHRPSVRRLAGSASRTWRSLPEPRTTPRPQRGPALSLRTGFRSD
jgi:hypothetical protein